MSRRGRDLAGVEVLEELSRGAQTVVHRVRRAGFEYALKQLRPEVVVDDATLVAFRREAAILATIDHPGLTRIHEVGQTHGRPYLLMDLVEGSELTELTRKGPMPDRRVVELGIDVAGALAAAHRVGLVHRDVKPQNIMVPADGEAKVIDFGLAAWAASDRGEVTAGTLAYSSPEQTGMLKRPVDGRSDLYSLGVVLFQCLAGVLPFAAQQVGDLLRMHAVSAPPDLRQLCPGGSRALVAVVEKLLAKDPDDRYQTAHGLLADLHLLRTDPDPAGFTPGAEDSPDGRSDTRLSGREPELAELTERWRQAVDGRGGVAVVQGAPGVGKSRLVRELVAAVRAGGHPVLYGKGSTDNPVPMAAVRAAVDQYVRDVQRLPEPARGAAVGGLRSAAGPAAPLLRALSPALAAVLEGPDLAEEDRGDQFVTAVAGFLVGLARAGGGLLLHLDDVQWLDGATMRVLRQLTADLADAPLMVVATARDDPASRPGLDRYRAALGASVDLHLPLAPLDDAGMAALVAAHLPGGELDADLVGRLSVRSDGNPFALVEYVRAVIDAGLLRPYWGTWLLDTAGLDGLALPQGALELVLTRVEGLGARSRALLTVAAVCGSRFRPDLVAEVSGVDRREAGAILVDAAGRHLVDQDGDEYTFVHDRIREALLKDLDEARLRGLHQRVAETLDAEDPGGERHVYALAHHYANGEKGRTPRRVFETCHAAGRLALAGHTPAAALALLQQAAEAAVAAGTAPDAEFLHTLGIAQHQSGRFAEACDSLEQALRVARMPLVRATILWQLALVHRSTWNTNASIAAVEQATAELGRPLPRNRVLLVLSTLLLFAGAVLIGVTRIGFGAASAQRRDWHRLRTELHRVAAHSAVIGQRPSEAVVHNMRALYHANRVGFSAEYARQHASLAFIYRMLGLRRRARRGYARAARTADQLADPGLVAQIAWEVSASEYFSGSGTGAVWVPVIEEHGRWLEIGTYCDAVAAICWGAVIEGNTRDALHWQQRARAHLEARGQAANTSLAMAEAAIPAMLGRAGAATTALRAVNEASAAHASVGMRVGFLTAAAHAALEQDDLGASFDTVLAEFGTLGVKPGALLPPQRAFSIYRAYGRLSQARRATGSQRQERLAAARAAVAALRPVANRPLLKAHRAVAEADLRQLEGDSAGALDHLAAQDRLLREVDAPLVTYEAARVRARALRDLGYADQARLPAATALTLADEQQWPHRARWIEAEFAMPDHRAAGSPGHRSSIDVATSDAQRQRLHAIEQVSMAASRVLDPGRLARIALDETIRILAADRAVLFLPDGADFLHGAAGADSDGHGDTGGGLVAHLGRDAAGHDIDELTGYSSTLVERVRRTGEAMVMTGTDEGVALGSESVVVHGLRSIMAAPLQLEGRLLGVVYLDSRVAKGVFTMDDVGVLVAITNHIAVSLETTRMVQLEVAAQTARQQRDVAEALHGALTLMGGTLDPQEVLERLLEAALRVLPGERAWLVTGEGPDRGVLAAPDPPPGAPPIALPPALLAPERPMVGTAETRPAAWGSLLDGAASWAVLPIVTGTEHIGILVLASFGTAVYQEADLEMAVALVGQGVIAYEKARLFTQVRELAIHDELTGVANRRHFFDLAKRDLAAARRHGRPLTAVMIDIDHFKRVNDTHGHLVGDDVIRGVADRLGHAIRDTDILGRYGGEEFALIMPDAHPASTALAERLRASIADVPVDTRIGPLPVTISVGTACLHADDPDVNAVLSRADAALYRAKSAGRNRVEGEAPGE
ncbi:diguanylate cyclase [Actinoplanes sp. NPDC049681]|uniref:diguanylate cyclase n=1 Tax=Actinoplanes sp. NPDC049681 TaxID=3363905 RepID=UPI0037959AAE